MVTSSVRRLFSTRNVIIVSEHKIDHHQVSGRTQILVGALVIGFFSFVSYMSGSYMAAQSLLDDKEKKLQQVSTDKNRIDEEFTLLRRDLSKLRDNGQELKEYGRILDTHQAKKEAAAGTIATSTQDSPMMARIDYLERRIAEISGENEQLISAIRERTGNKLDFYEDLISSTGINLESLEQQVSKTHKDKVADSAKTVKASANPENQGGPYVPSKDFSEQDKQLLGNIDRLMVLRNILDVLPTEKPVRGAKEMSPFGIRQDPFTGHPAMHTGLDLAAPSGARITAANNGIVTKADAFSSYGNAVDIDHGYGISTRYGHLSQILVTEGQRVRKGQVIGIQGSTGRSTGEHLHFEVRYNDRPLNPANFLKAGEYVSKE